jgi:hypothetical protein
MVLTEFFAALTAELALLTPRYDTRRVDHPVLARYESLAALFAEAKAYKVDKKWVVSPEGQAIRCALLELYQKTHDRLWAALLLKVFSPMLRGIAKKLVGSSPEERESLLLACFHRALQRVDPYKDPARLSLFLFQKTRRPLFRALKKESEWEEVGFGDEAELTADPATLSDPLLSRSRYASPGRSRAPRHLLLETARHRGALRALVRQRYGSLSGEEQGRVFRRLQQQRRRHVRALRRRSLAKAVES